MKEYFNDHFKGKTNMAELWNATKTDFRNWSVKKPSYIVYVTDRAADYMDAHLERYNNKTESEKNETAQADGNSTTVESSVD